MTANEMILDSDSLEEARAAEPFCDACGKSCLAGKDLCENCEEQPALEDA